MKLPTQKSIYFLMNLNPCKYLLYRAVLKQNIAVVQWYGEIHKTKASFDWSLYDRKQNLIIVTDISRFVWGISP